MRITTRSMELMNLRSLQNELQLLDRAQREALSGRRVQTMSDDPVDASSIMRYEAGLRDVGRYRRNITAATTRLNTEDLVLGTAADLISQAKQVAIRASTFPPGDPQRQAALAELDQLREQFLSLANTRIGTEYIFGGGETMVAPFKADGSYVGDQFVRRTEVDAGVYVDINHPGNKMFSQSIQGLDDLIVELQTGSTADISAVVNDLTTAGDQLLVTQAEIGAVLGQIQKTETHLGARANGLMDRTESLRDVDPSEALLRVTTVQTALERAYAVLGRAVSVHLVDFLR